MSERRVVITGLGCITALAESPEGMFAAVCQGKSGISNIEAFDTSGFTVRFGGEVKNFDMKKYAGHRESKRMDRFTQMALASAIQAVDDSGLDFDSEDLERVGVIVGTGIGGLQEIEDQHSRLLNKGPRKVSPFTVSLFITDSQARICALLPHVPRPVTRSESLFTKSLTAEAKLCSPEVQKLRLRP
jgi:3-oxoacyl-[acyl-carrier-protein] synthase II